MLALEGSHTMPLSDSKNFLDLSHGLSSHATCKLDKLKVNPQKPRGNYVQSNQVKQFYIISNNDKQKSRTSKDCVRVLVYSGWSYSSALVMQRLLKRPTRAVWRCLTGIMLQVVLGFTRIVWDNFISLYFQSNARRS